MTEIITLAGTTTALLSYRGAEGTVGYSGHGSEFTHIDLKHLGSRIAIADTVISGPAVLRILADASATLVEVVRSDDPAEVA